MGKWVNREGEKPRYERKREKLRMEQGKGGKAEPIRPFPIYPFTHYLPFYSKSLSN